MPTELRLALFDAPPLERRFAAAGPSSNSPGRPIDLKELLATIDGVDPASCRRVVVSAARPRMHPGLEPLLDRCRERGLGGVTLECEGAALGPDGEVEWFSQRGVVRVDVVLGGIRRKVHEAVMRDVSGWLPAMRGVRAAAEGATELSVRLPLLQWSAEDAVPLLEWLLALPGRLHGFFLAPPRVDEVPAHARAVLLSQPEQARIAARVFDICRRHGLDYGFSSPHAISPCASRELDAFGTVFHQRIRHYQHEPTADLVAIAACSECSLHPSCRGIERAYVERFGERELAAVPLDASMGWRLQRTSRLDEHDYKNVSAFENDHEGLGRSLVRVNGHCQMACAFCFVDRTAPDFDTDALEREITTLAQHQTDHLVLSGGEPTLHPDLPRLIEHARTLQFRTIEIQTNGVRSADLEYARSLAAAGLGKATASLHSADPERSDAITKMRGAFPKTLRALHHFRALGLRTQIAHVVTKENYRELPAFVRFVREEFPEEGGHLSLCLAIAQGISDLVYSWAIPTFTEIKPYFREALDYCLETRLGFGGMIGQGGYPPCMLDGELAYYAANFQNVYRSADHDAQFYKAPRCVDCSFDPYCIGVRRDYIACYGDAELRPFRAPPGALEGTRPIGPSAPEPPHAGQMPRELVRLRRKSA